METSLLWILLAKKHRTTGKRNNYGTSVKGHSGLLLERLRARSRQRIQPALVSPNSLAN
jgi:hypothetical protein